jgi:hypothetical protein
LLIAKPRAVAWPKSRPACKFCWVAAWAPAFKPARLCNEASTFVVASAVAAPGVVAWFSGWVALRSALALTLASVEALGCAAEEVDGLVGGAGVVALASACIEPSCEAEASAVDDGCELDWISDWVLVEAPAPVSDEIELSAEVVASVEFEDDVSVEVAVSVELELLVDGVASVAASAAAPAELAESVAEPEASLAASAAASAPASMLCASEWLGFPSHSAAAKAGAAHKNVRFMANSPV